MLWSSGSSFASRAASCGRSPLVPDLDLVTPSVHSPAGEEDFTVSEDLKIAGVINPTGLLGLPDLGISGAQRKSRGEILDVVTSFVASSAVPGTTLPFEAVVIAIAPKASPKVGAQVLPMQSESSLFAFSEAPDK